MDVLLTRTAFYTDIGTHEPSFVNRIAGVGRMSRERALEQCVAGPFARASGVDMDLRRDLPYGAYAELDFNVITSDRCDILGRVIVRALEIVESCKMVTQLLEQLPEGELVAKRVPRRVPAGVAISLYEAPRGEDIHYVRSNGTEKPERVKVRAPTIANLEAATESVVGSYVADIPIAIASIDPCFSCTDRLTIGLNDDQHGPRVTSWGDLRRYGIAWYRERGVSFPKTR
jgi:NADH-quinone oxidoreductase subunit D